jgi:hypothetical protein
MISEIVSDGPKSITLLAKIETTAGRRLVKVRAKYSNMNEFNGVEVSSLTSEAI